MNRPIANLLLPDLPAGKEQRPYDRDLHYALRKWQSEVIAQLNSQSQGIGPTLASGPALTVSNYIHHVSGTAAIQTITAAPNFTGSVKLIADGAWTTVTTGNIALAVTATPGRAYEFTYTGSLWYPTASA